MPSVRRIEWAPRATEDLKAIWRYNANAVSREAAGKIVREIGDAVVGLDRLKVPGRPREDLLPGLRSVLTRPYLVFFRASEARIEIVRILHERRDLYLFF